MASRQGNSFSGDGGPALQSKMWSPQGLAFDKESRLVVADTSNHRIRRITNPGSPSAAIETIAGNGTATDTGDGGPAANATFAVPFQLSYTADGTLFVACAFNFRLRTILPNGIMGSGWGPGIRSCKLEDQVCYAYSLAGDSADNMLVGDISNQIYAISPQGKFTDIAGKVRYSTGSFSGDGGPATQASFWDIMGLGIDAQKNTFVSDSSNQRIRRITPDGIIRTITGTGKGGKGGAFGGDDGPALEADLAFPTGIAVDAQGKVYFIDSANFRIRVLVPCAFELKAESSTFDSLGGTGDVSLSSNERGCRWSAASDAPWLTLISRPSGMGSEKLSIRVAPNTSNAGRTGSIRVGAKSVSITQLAAGVVFPQLSTANHRASFSSGVPAGSWVTLTGTNLWTWTDADFVGNRLPSVLDGVSVKIGGRDASIYFISPTQLNVLAPSNLPPGPAAIEVTNRMGKGSLMSTIIPIAPGFFLVTAPKDGVSLAAALHTDGVLAGETGAIPGVATRPAKPGDSIALFGTGFGPTISPIPDGEAPAAPTALANELTVFVGGQRALVDYAGVVSPGLVQVNIRVPEFLPGARHSIVAAIGGVESPPIAAIAVE